MMAAIRTKRLKDPRNPQDGTRIFVARYRPRFLRKGAEPWDEWIKELAPSRELHATWYGKGGRKPISFEEFARRYEQEMQAQKETINKLARRALAGEAITLLCYCADEARCHRTLLKEMVEEAARILRQRT